MYGIKKSNKMKIKYEINKKDIKNIYDYKTVPIACASTESNILDI